MANTGVGKSLVLDTSVLVEYPCCLEKFANSDNTVIIPGVVIRELDGLKKGAGQRNYNARKAVEIILDLAKEGSLVNGVTVGGGGLVRIDCSRLSSKDLPDSLDLGQKDDEILAVAYNLTKSLSLGKSGKVVLLTLDNVMTLKAHCLGIEVEDIKDIKVNMRSLYDENKYREINLTGESMEIIKEKKKISLRNIEYALGGKLFRNNEFVVANNNRKYAMCCRDDWLNVIPAPEPVFSIRPMFHSLAQHFAWNLLFDGNVEIVTLIGEAGTGKTFLALVSALAQLEAFPQCGSYKKLYDRIVVITPTVVVSEEQDMGFLPGSHLEKMSPWVQAVFDNLKIIKRSIISADKIIEELCAKGILEFVNINHIRGRSLADSCIIVDEAQNFFCSETKLIGTRPASGSKIIFTGDPSQVNRRFLREDNNGLVRTVEAFKDCKEAGVVFLGSGDIVRSRVSQLFAERF